MYVHLLNHVYLPSLISQLGIETSQRSNVGGLRGALVLTGGIWLVGTTVAVGVGRGRAAGGETTGIGGDFGVGVEKGLEESDDLIAGRGGWVEGVLRKGLRVGKGHGPDDEGLDLEVREDRSGDIGEVTKEADDGGETLVEADGVHGARLGVEVEEKIALDKEGVGVDVVFD